MKKAAGRSFLGICASVLLIPIIATADSPYRTSVAGDVSAIQNISSDLHDGAVRRASPLRVAKAVRLSFAAKGLGKVDAQLSRIHYKDWTSFIQGPAGSAVDQKDVILVAGSARVRGEKVPVGGSIYRSNGHPRLFLILNSGKKTSRSAYVRVRLDSNSKVLPARVSSLPKSLVSGLGCGTEQAHQIGNTLREASGSISAKAVVTGGASILTHADPEYYAAYGADTNAHIATLISAASAIYQSQMGIYLTVASQFVYTSQTGNPYTATDAGQLLTQFQNNLRSLNVLNNATAFHLFSGKDFVGSVIGLAYVGAICSYADYSVGTTQKYNPLADASIFAHELGHNFGATHDSSDSRSMMAPVVNIPGSTYFSATSISQIQSHLAGADACLDQNGVPPSGGGGGGGVVATPTPNDPSSPGDAPDTRIAVSVNSQGLMTITMAVDSVQDGCSLRLYGSTSASSTGQLLKEFYPTGVTTRFRLAGLKDPRNGRSALYFKSRSVCDGSTATSDSKGANLNVIRAKTSASIDRVLQSIGNALARIRK